jgi:branched-chain amino acid transport system substrate-binding protein
MRNVKTIPRMAAAALALALASLLVLTATAGASRQSHGAQAKPPVILGAAVAQSGGFELYDNSVLAGVRWLMKRINANGGVDGRMFKLIVADNKTDPAQVQAAAEDVLDQGADVVITTADYDFGAAAALAAKKAKKISIGGAGAPEYGATGLGPYHFNVYNGTPTESAALAEFTKTKGWKRPYLLRDTSIAYSKDVCEFYKKALPAGITVAGESDFKNSDPSIASQVGEVRRSNADVVVLCSYPPGGAAAVRQIRTGGIDLPILGGAGFDGTFWLKSTPNLSNFYYDAMVSSALDDPNPKVNQFVKSVKAPGGTIYALFGYEVVETIAKALAMDGGKADGPALAKAIESFKNEPLLVGRTTYTKTCHVAVGRQMAMIEIQSGKAKFLSYSKPKKVPPAPC